MQSLAWVAPFEIVDDDLLVDIEQLSLPRVVDQKDALLKGYVYVLSQHDHLLHVVPADKKLGGPVNCNFDSGAASFRRKNAGIKQEIARACGLKKDARPSILDATAGLGGDAFVLASLGSHVTMIEQNPVVHLLLKSGLRAASVSEDDELSIIASDKMRLAACQSSLDFFAELQAESFDVVYLDPMFPDRRKSAKVKKGMQYFHDLVGIDSAQEPELLTKALLIAGKRVVVKRPKQAPYLADRKPSLEMSSKTIRYDIYLV
ncbi:Ribosomal RNA small subunit methyltransferase J [BD1-7 clade bacterium]|uniref:Ribosomal RNA small subunit methyltransferase J n=1 Tax=BD1-7 clade bacterium TaxID=2029982 RepID=A0A5S9R083_9GAMM|nr:Ribosomal RNA small subunit methyltransferase J [BD1-7 clade bacterium]